MEQIFDNKVNTIRKSSVYERNMRWNYYFIVFVSRGTNGLSIIQNL